MNFAPSSSANSAVAAPPEPGAGGSGELVCHCHQVGETTIRRAIDAAEAGSIDEITSCTGAGASCRGCHCQLQRMLAGGAPNCSRFSFCNECRCIRALCECHSAGAHSGAPTPCGEVACNP